MRSSFAIGAILLLAAGYPVAAQTRPAAKVPSAGGVPAVGAELAAETTARVNADATEMANRTNADTALQEQITQIQAALAGQQGGARSAVGTVRIETNQIAEFPIYGFVVGASMPASIGGPGGGTGRAQLKDVTFTKIPDVASPSLFDALVTGEHVRKATFTMPAQTGKTPKPPYRVITLENLMFTNVDMGAFDALESYSMDYGKICIQYFPVSGPSTQTCFDVTKSI